MAINESEEIDLNKSNEGKSFSLVRTKMNIAKQIIDEKISEGKSFSLEEIEKDIIKQGGICRISPGFTTTDYVKVFEEMGVVKLNPYDNNYIVFNGRLEILLENNYNPSLSKN